MVTAVPVTTNDVGADVAFLFGIAVGMILMAKLMGWALKRARELLDERTPPPGTDEGQ